MTSKVERILNCLEPLYEKERDTHPLDYQGVWQLLIGTILSARNRDDTVNKVTPQLFKKWPTPAALAAAPIEEIEQTIKKIGISKTKAQHLKKCSEVINTKHAGKVPNTRQELEALAGVGRKTANIILMYGFNKPAVAVDTHVQRIANRTGICIGNVKDVEAEFAEFLPESEWWKVNRLLLAHGRAVCMAKRPDCEHCAILDECDYGKLLGIMPASEDD